MGGSQYRARVRFGGVLVGEPLMSSDTRLGLLILGVALFLSIGGIIYLAATDHQIPEVLVATASGALGAIGGVVTGARMTQRDPDIHPEGE